jgi:pimeloyl-ACP methyl ester carboxylesterase
MIPFLDIGSGKPLILIHGLGQRYDKAWQAQYKLAEKYRLIIPSLRGHFGSNINTDITLENLALDVIELMEHLHIESAYICGLSLGGLVAQEIYRQREDLISGLIIANSTFYIPSYFANKIVKKSEKLFHEDKNKLIEHITETTIHNEEVFEEAKQSFYLSDVYLKCAISGSGMSYFPVLLRLDKPLLLIGGNYDRTTPLINQVIMRWLCPRSELVTLDSGHLSNIECPSEFNQKIREFIG